MQHVMYARVLRTLVLGVIVLGVASVHGMKRPAGGDRNENKRIKPNPAVWSLISTTYFLVPIFVFARFSFS